MITNTKKENYICQKIIKLMKMNRLTTKELLDIIIKNSTNEIKALSSITLDRLNEIVQGNTPSLIECILIGQVLGKDLGYFYYNTLKSN